MGDNIAFYEDEMCRLGIHIVDGAKYLGMKTESGIESALHIGDDDDDLSNDHARTWMTQFNISMLDNYEFSGGVKCRSRKLKPREQQIIDRAWIAMKQIKHHYREYFENHIFWDYIAEKI